MSSIFKHWSLSRRMWHLRNSGTKPVSCLSDGDKFY